MKIHVPALIIVIVFGLFIAIVAMHDRKLSQITPGCANCQQSTEQVLQQFERDLTASAPTAEDRMWLNRGMGLSKTALTVDQIRGGQ